MAMSAARRSALVGGLLLTAVACSTTRQAQAPTEPAPGAQPAPSRPGARTADVFESHDFVVTVAKAGDTAETLAARHLGDPKKKWMIEDYIGVRTFAEGQEVVIPKRELEPGRRLSLGLPARARGRLSQHQREARGEAVDRGTDLRRAHAACCTPRDFTR